MSPVDNNFLVTEPAWAIDFAPNGTLLKEGDTITRRRYADTLQAISEGGADVFYTGAIAEATIQAIQAANGTMTLEDLANYTVAIRTPVQIDYRNYRITSCAAPSGGEVALAAMKIVEGYDDFGWSSALNISTYRLNEAMRWAYAERVQLGDPSYVAGTEAYEQEMISAKSAREIRKKITHNTHGIKYYDPSGLGGFQNHGTSHISTADHTGMGVSLTTTINLLFGSQVIVPETGVILNDEMNDFSIPGSSNAFGYLPSPNNFIEPGKRPLSSMSPTIVEHLDNSTLYFLTGAAGGSQIITATIQNLWHVLDQNKTCIEALASPRFHDQLAPNEVEFEYTYDNETVAFLKNRGANVSFVEPGSSTAQAVRLLPNGTFEAAGEPRQDDSGGFAI